jgi:branched-subunit amino acid transport protein
MIWVTLASVSALCLLLRAAVPILSQRWAVPAAVERRLEGVFVPVIAALVAQELFTDGRHLALDARTPGAVAGCTVLLLRRPLLVAIVVAAVVTAGLRRL